MLLQGMPQAQIESIAENQLVELRQTGKMSYEREANVDTTPQHPHGAYRKVILFHAVCMITRESHGSQQLELPLRVVLGTQCTCITSAHDAHMCIEATQEPCWLQAAPPVTPDRNASRADRQARRLGITSQPDTAAGPGRSPGQASAANAAVCFEALNRAIASNPGPPGSRDAGGAVTSKGAAGGKGHQAAVGSASGGGKSSFSFGAALGVKKKPAAAPAVASAVSAAATPAAGGEQGTGPPPRPAADASEPRQYSATAAPGRAASSKEQELQHSSSGGGSRDRPGSSGGVGGGPAQAATPPAFISQLAARQPPQVDCSAVLCSTSTSLLAHALHACGIPPANHITDACPALVKCDVSLLPLTLCICTGPGGKRRHSSDRGQKQKEQGYQGQPTLYVQVPAAPRCARWCRTGRAGSRQRRGRSSVQRPAGWRQSRPAPGGRRLRRCHRHSGSSDSSDGKTACETSSSTSCGTRLNRRR